MTNSSNLVNNRYQILSSLGRGGFGETFLVQDLQMPSLRQCVLKQLKPANESLTESWVLDRFQREAAILEHLGRESSQIPSLYAYFVENGNFYLVQEYIEGCTLTTQVTQGGVFSEKQTQQLLRGILPVLSVVHHNQIIHRDLKPDNIMIRTVDQLPVLIDFGAVKESLSMAHFPESTQPYSMAIGTPGYMASEQAAGRPVFSSDLYSLAMVALFCLTGQTPQEIPTDPETGEVMWRSQCAGLSDEFAQVLDRALAFHPRDRFYSAAEMYQALQGQTPSPPTRSTSAMAPAPTATLATQAIAPGLGRTPMAPNSPAQRSQPQTTESGNGCIYGLITLIVVAALSFGLSYVFLSEFQKWWNQPRTVFTEEPEPTPRPVVTPPPVVEEPEPEPESEPEPIPEEVVEPEPEPEPEPIPEEEPEVVTPNPPVANPPLTKTIPIVRLGTTRADVLRALGTPTTETAGFLPNSVNLSYPDYAPGQVDLSYFVDTTTNEVRQTEIAFSQSVDLQDIKRAATSLVGELSPEVDTAISEIYQGDTDLRTWNDGDRTIIVQRGAGDRLSIAVWDPEFR